MKVVVLAELCNPEWPSLPSFSYSLAKALSRHCEILLVTHIRNKEALSNEQHQLDAEIVYIDNEKYAGKLYRITQKLDKIGLGGYMTYTGFNAFPYIMFERMAFKALKGRINDGEFDVAIRISPVSPIVPSPFAKLADLPFILGPINGGLKWLDEFEDVVEKEGEWIRHFRNLYHFFPYYSSTYSHAAKVLASFSHALGDIPKKHHHKVEFFDELGVHVEQFKRSNQELRDDKLSFVSVGRLVPLKCVDVLIQAFANSTQLQEHAILRIVGDGPERQRLEEMVEENQLNSSVIFEGWLSQPEVSDILSQSNVFVFPTIREAGGNVVLEAMASGLPCIVPRFGGPSELVDNQTGIIVPLSSKAQLIADFKAAMEKFLSEPDLLKTLSDAAYLKAQNVFDWDKKGRRLSQICADVAKLKHN